jgi:Peptidase C13 family
LKTILLAAALSVTLAACTSIHESASHGPLPQPTGWKAVLIAGDDQEPAFDNAVDAMAAKLARLGIARRDITILKATARGAQAATKENIVEAFANLTPGHGQGCFIFVTSHGGRDSGLVMTRAQAMLTPSDLDDLLRGPCEDKPTVVIASGCFSGIFAEGGSMPATNRVILTAARDDRTSFGCDAKRKYTVFDECVLGSIERGLPWQAVMDQARACVASDEQKLGVMPSSPQIWIGGDVASLRTS